MINHKVFCALPWGSIHFRPTGDFMSCCVAEDKSFITDTRTKTLDELYNSEQLKQLRLDLLAGNERPDVCTHCYAKDAANVTSNRTTSLQYFAQDIKKFIESTDNTGRSDINNIKYWDIRPSNLCNIKCRTCNEDFSSSWAAENNHLDKIKLKSIDKDILEDIYGNVRHIYFAGGETLLMPEHFALLTRLIENNQSKKVEISYTSNLTKLDYNNHNLIELWKNFKEVTVNVSLDGVEDKFNYIRHGVDWEIVKANILQLKQSAGQFSHMQYNFITTVSIFNILNISETHRYLWENNLMNDINDINIDLVMYPIYFAFINVLPKNLKLVAIERLNNHITWLADNKARQSTINKFLSIVKFINNDLENDESQPLTKAKRNFLDGLRIRFVHTVKKIDNRRNESFVDTFPELAEMFNYYENNFNFDDPNIDYGKD